MGQLIALADDPTISTNDFVMAKNIYDVLLRHYPGHPWGVSCDGAKTGMAVIQHMALDPRYGYYIRLAELNGDSHMRLVVKAGGEILERFRQRRGAMNADHIESLPHAADGWAMFDAAGMKGRLPSWAKPQPRVIKVSEWRNK